MIYKYMEAEWGLKFLQTGKIRYTQFSALNDPYEGRVFIRNLLTPEQQRKKSVGKLIKDEVNSMIIDLLEKLKRGENAFYELEISKCIKELKSQRDRFGVLSMSRKENSLPMWAHYGESHMGIVVGFDEFHSYFQEGEYKLRDVTYYREHPESYLSVLTAIDLLFKKSIQWNYEEEVRQPRLLEKANEMTENPKTGDKVFLFDVPRDCVVRIILGERASNITENAVKLIKDFFPSIVLEKASVVENSYDMNIGALDPNVL